MMETKYIIMIGIAICLLILYYFYDDISNIKKSFIPMYQKTMELEAKVLKLESDNKIIVKNDTKNKNIIKNETPTFSISYQSDVVGKNNLSARYTDISETETNNLLKIINPVRERRTDNISHNKTTQLSLAHNKIISDKNNIVTILNSDKHSNSPNNNKSNLTNNNNKSNLLNNNKPNLLNNNKSNLLNNNKSSSQSHLHSKQLSDFDIPFDKTKNIDISEESDTFNVKISDLVKNNSNLQAQKSPTQIAKEYQEILDSLAPQVTDELQTENIQSENPQSENPQSENLFDDELDQDVIRSITESIRYADMPSETILSDINLSCCQFQINQNQNKLNSSLPNKKNTSIKKNIKN